MSTEANKALVRRYYEEIANAENVDAATSVADSLLTPAFAFYTLNDDQGTHGLQQHKEFLVWHHNAVPDQHWTVEAIVAEGDLVATHWRTSGTQRGEFLGVLPTGRRIALQGMDLFRLADDRIAELRRFFDLMDVMQQLGAVPPSE
jgi:steroid delta-isomerase-like uncharacterized protein